jgi:hypothetical protein
VLLRYGQHETSRCQFLLQIVLSMALPKLVNRRDFLLTVALDTVNVIELSLAVQEKQVCSLR